MTTLCAEVSRKCVKKILKLGSIKGAVRPDAAAHIDAERSYDIDGLANIGGRESAGEIDRNLHQFTDAAAYLPIVHTARSAEFLHFQGRVAGIEEQSIDMAGDGERLLDCVSIADMNHLNNPDPGQCAPDFIIASCNQPVDDLNCRCPDQPLVLDDPACAGPAGQEK